MATGGISMERIILLLGESWPLLMQGAVMTAKLWCCASFISLVVGTMWGILRCDRFRVAYVSTFLDGLTFVFRGIPFYVQLLMAYFVVPSIIGMSLSAFMASLISLGLCSAGYVSQIVRGGINAISLGQWEAAQMLGYSQWNTVRYVIMPQALRIVLPALVGECDQLLKSTSVVSAIGVLELTGAGRNIIAQEMNPLAIYTVLALLYLLMSALLALYTQWLERRLSL